MLEEMYNIRRDCISKGHCSIHVYAIAILFVSCLIQDVHSDSSKNDCSQEQKWTEEEEQLLKRLEPLKGTVLNVTVDDTDDKQKYVYSIGICTSVDTKRPCAGAVQYGANDSHTLGMINSTEILGGDVWISLQYNGGDNYSGHCAKQSRLANIMFICDESATTEKLNFVEERRKKESGLCYYLFEINTKTICPEKKKLSTGSVICLIIVPCCVIYLLLGFLYRRVVVGAKGLEQIPNYAFWQDFGNLQADGCDFICRCGSRQQSQAYRGIDDCLEREEEERDDQLLAM